MISTTPDGGGPRNFNLSAVFLFLPFTKPNKNMTYSFQSLPYETNRLFKFYLNLEDRSSSSSSSHIHNIIHNDISLSLPRSTRGRLLSNHQTPVPSDG